MGKILLIYIVGAAPYYTIMFSGLITLLYLSLDSLLQMQPRLLSTIKVNAITVITKANTVRMIISNLCLLNIEIPSSLFKALSSE